jgi:hypothetical protein
MGKRLCIGQGNSEVLQKKNAAGDFPRQQVRFFFLMYPENPHGGFLSFSNIQVLCKPTIRRGTEPHFLMSRQFICRLSKGRVF